MQGISEMLLRRWNRAKTFANIPKQNEIAVLILCSLFHGTVWLQETAEQVIASWTVCQLTAIVFSVPILTTGMFTTKLCPQVPYPNVFWTLSEMVTPALLWAVLFVEKNFLINGFLIIWSSLGATWGHLLSFSHADTCYFIGKPNHIPGKEERIIRHILKIFFFIWGLSWN